MLYKTSEEAGHDGHNVYITVSWLKLYLIFNFHKNETEKGKLMQILQVSNF